LTLASWDERPGRLMDLLRARDFRDAGTAATNPDAEPILDTASRLGWTVVSMRRDWNRVFAG
jgi:hypothetical protein